MILAGAHIILPDRILRAGHLRIEEGVIAEVSALPIARRGDEEIKELGGLYVAPGFIDLHIHGALGRDTMEAGAEAFDTICRHHATGGTTALCLTTIAAPLNQILAVITAARQYCQAAPRGARVLGVHIEGPYFSPEKKGAHLPSMLRNPDPAEWRQLLEHADMITQMTLAPELPGALPLIEALAQRGIIASAGHSDAWDEEIAAAFAHGLRHATHTFNCMSMSRRRGPYRAAGVLEFVLSEPEILCEVIADGRHVSPTLLQLLCRAKGADGIALITDATAGAGLPPESRFKLGEIVCVARDGVALTEDGTTLAGSTSSMIRGVRNMVELCGLSMVEAVKIASLNPARALGIDTRKGSIAPGMDADLVILSPDIEVSETWVGGQPCHTAQKSA
ncbi:MAG: N-acetylglucosamine-6-phosphate deacetylase [Chthoniobacteraceae bacterium]|jgi:N-acetylglucosamine-6-phosphate deacetylase